MELLVTSFWMVHVAITVAILVGWLLDFFTIAFGLIVMAWAGRIQIIIGLILVNLTFAHGLDYGFVIIKLILALIMVGLIEVANVRAKREQPSRVLPALAAALAVAIAAFSFLW
jgi:hypothetical protein